MGPIEQSFVNRARELREQFRPRPVLFVRKVQIVDNSIHLQAKVDRLLEELSEARNEIDQLKAELGPAGPTYQQHIHRIIRLVCKTEGVSLSDVLSQRRTKNVCFPRHIVFYLAATTTNHSLPVIGRYFGGRDHTTILHGKSKIAALRLIDPILDGRLRDYEKLLAS